MNALKLFLFTISLVTLTACTQLTGQNPDTPVGSDPSEPPVGTDVQIQNEFDNKIVYGMKAEDTERYRQHCAERGGTFNECGSPCAPDADVCIEVCAYTCTLN